MSQSTMEMLPAAPMAPEGGTNKKVLVAGALAAAVALGGAGYFLLLSGGDSTDQGLVAPVRKATTKTVKPAVTTAKKATAAKAAVVPATSTARLGRDPFRALYVLQPEKPAGTTTAPSTTSSSSTSTAPKPGAEYPLKLVSFTNKGMANANTYLFTFTVDGVKKTVMQGQRFGKYGELVVLGYAANSKGKVVGAIIQVGDDNPFGVLAGETISVQ